MTSAPLNKKIRVTLLDTAAPNAPGSMRRYADLVEKALTTAAMTPRVELHRQRIPWRWPNRVAAPLKPWARHLECAWQSRFVAPQRAASVSTPVTDVVHLVDGSYAYLLKLLPVGPARFVTIHDLIPTLQIAGELAPSPGRLTRALIAKSQQGWANADLLASVSEHSQRDLQRHCSVADEQCRVIPNPLDPFWLAVSPIPLADRSQLILHVGSNEHYKNRAGVLEIFAAANLESARLQMAGAEPTAELTALAKKLGIEQSVDWIIRPSDEQLRSLYQQARVLLFPSKYEGFGWPLLEAMGAGCAVVCSDAASLPEVLGGAGQAIEVADTQRFAKALQALCSDAAGLQSQQQLADAGYQRAKAFSLSRFAEQLMDGYLAAINQRKATQC